MKYNNTTFSKLITTSFILAAAISTSCNNDDVEMTPGTPSDNLSEEYYAGGKLGTTFDRSSQCFEQSTEAVANAGLSTAFLRGEGLFEDPFINEANPENQPQRGLGPVSIRTSCINCHPGYGHGKRLGDYLSDVTGFDTSSKANGNGYLLSVFRPDTENGVGVQGDGKLGSSTGWKDGASDPDYEDNGFVLDLLTGMPQTQSQPPFPAPLDESLINIIWHAYDDTEYDNKFADGTDYQLIYPEVVFNTEAAYEGIRETLGTQGVNFDVRLEATIGIYGTGLLDAITEEDIDAEAESQSGTSYAGRRGGDIVQLDGTTRKGRFTYGLTRGTLQHGPGSNAIWNITNVTRDNSYPSIYRANYMAVGYAEAVSKDEDILNQLATGGNGYYGFLIQDGDATSEKTKNAVYNYLMYNSTYAEAKLDATTILEHADTQKNAEMSLDEYTDFMVWHRGLAVPAARDLDDETVQRGRELFYTQYDESIKDWEGKDMNGLSCTSCHRPTWTTGSDNYVGDADMDGELPRYPNQKIWPYTDMLQHNLGMENNIRTGWCRTTPLWGRYLNIVANGQSSHLHDMRARSYEEAILWHRGQAEHSSQTFRKLSEDDREALVKFLQSI